MKKINVKEIKNKLSAVFGREIRFRVWAGVLCLAGAALAGAGAALLTADPGDGRQQKQSQGQAYFEMEKKLADYVLETYEKQVSAAAEREAARRVNERIAAENWVPQLSEKQKEILDELAEDLSQNRLEEAGTLMLAHSREIEELYSETTEGTLYLYRNGELHQEIEGEGVVLKQQALAFWGNFKDGAPEGECAAIHLIDIDYPRYDYAVGHWENGVMNGEGTIGYRYLEVSDEDNQNVYREGIFKNNRMDGEVLYSTTDREGETATWNMTLSDGKIVFDDRWIYDNEREVYQLPSNQESGHVYSVEKNSSEEIWFQNLILWQ